MRPAPLNALFIYYHLRYTYCNTCCNGGWEGPKGKGGGKGNLFPFFHALSIFHFL